MIYYKNKKYNKIEKEYKKILESLDSVNKSIINRGIQILPIYKIDESYIIDLDTLSHVINYNNCTIKEAVQKIKDANYIDSDNINCLLPKIFNEKMTINQFIYLYDNLNEANINLICTKKVSEYDFINESSKNEYKVGNKIVFRNFINILKNIKDNPTKTGNFKAMHPRSLKMVNNCKTMDEINYMRRDRTLAISQLKVLKKNRPDIADNIDEHIEWLNTVYIDALNKKAKEIKSKKRYNEYIKEIAVLEEDIIEYKANMVPIFKNESSYFVEFDDVVKYMNSLEIEDIKEAVNLISEANNIPYDQLSVVIEEKEYMKYILELAIEYSKYGDNALLEACEISMRLIELMRSNGINVVTTY